MSSTRERHQGLQVIAPAPDEGKSGGEITIDIVAVPGLGANPAKSFGSEKNPAFNWLSDRVEGIRAEIPHARVLLYYYDSEWYGSNAQEQNLHNCSSKLLEYLVEMRKVDTTRPLVFLGHSMGGLVVARAMTIAHQAYTNVDYMRIVDCFAGAMFFGTPFNGSTAQARAWMVAYLFEKINRGVQSQMLKVLKPKNDALVDLRRDFTHIILREPKAKVTCFWEEFKTNYAREVVPPALKSVLSKAGGGELVVTEDSASLDAASKFGLHRDHRQLNRFDSAQDREYILVRNQLKEICRSADFIVKTRLRAAKQSVVDDQAFYRLAINLDVGDVGVKLKSVQSSSGDSSWILSEDQYRRWAAPPRSSSDPSPHPVLWVSGGEGLGKSKAAAATIGALERREARNHQPGARNTMVAYFFCDVTPDCRMAETMLRALIWQLILKKRSLGQYVKSFAAPAQEGASARGSSTQSGGGQFRFSKLWKGLTDILSDDSVQDVYFVVNSLHCLSEGQQSTADFLEKLSESLTTGNDERDPVREKVRWAIFSRDDRPSMERVLRPGVGKGTVLQMDLNSTSMGTLRRETLRRFIRDEVRTVARRKQYSSGLQYFVFSTLQKRAENNRLWVEVVCKLLLQLPADYSTVRKALELLPADPQSLIEQAWNNVLDPKVYAGDAPLESVKEILRTLVIAYEHPTLSELRVLAELEVDLDSADPGATEDSIVLDYIRDCGPLLRTYEAAGGDGDGRWATRVTFIHNLARDALLSPDLRRRIGLAPDAGDTEVKWQHGVIGLRCWDYMQEQLGTAHDLDDDDFLLEALTEVPDPEQTEEFQADIDELFPENSDGDAEDDDKMDASALDYPLKYWLRHGNEATPDFIDAVGIKHQFWSLESTARKRWWGSFVDRVPREELKELKNITALHVAAYFGLLPLVNSLLEDGHANEIHSLDSWANQPLHWAAAKGNLAVCRRLLQVPGIEINNGMEKGNWTPLHMAAWKGQREVIEYLARKGANINAICHQHGTCLTVALVHRQVDAAALLVNLGADPTIMVIGEDKQVKSPLAVAAAQGSESLVTWLLQIRGEHDALASQYGAALSAAASVDGLKIVQTLLARNIDSRSREEALFQSSAAGFAQVADAILTASPGIPCGEAFIAAAKCGTIQIVQRLWHHHWNYRVLSQKQINDALYEATDMQQETVVKFLLEYCGADANATGDEYGNALTASAFDGTLTILQMLLARGAQIAAPRGYPLQVAALNGHVHIVRHLLEAGADPNAFHPAFPHGTALQAACVAGQTQIVQWLLSRRANPNRGGGEFTNPLTAATSNGHGEIVRLLLEARADPNQPGGRNGGTYPLVSAATMLPTASLEQLIRAGAHVDQKDANGNTALIMSALCGDTDRVTTLLRCSASVHPSSARHGSALHAAASSGSTDTCLALLNHGANLHILAGPFYTVLQAAAASGSPDCVKLILDRGGAHLNVDIQGGTFFTALHAAVKHNDDGVLRHLLAHNPPPALNAFPPKRHALAGKGTALHAAAFRGCNRNARLLIEAGADVNVIAGKHGSVLQIAALKCNPLLVELLLDSGAKIDGVHGKYGSALVAAVARAADPKPGWNGENDRAKALAMLLDHAPQAGERLEQQNQRGAAQQKETDLPGRFPANVYRSALETAVRLRQKNDFKSVLEKMQETADQAKKVGVRAGFPNVQGLLGELRKAAAARRRVKGGKRFEWDADYNSDFGDDAVNQHQEFYAYVESDEEDEGDDGNDLQKGDAAGEAQRTRGVGGAAQAVPVRGGPGWQGQQGEGTRGFSSGAVQPTPPSQAAQSRGLPVRGEQEMPTRGGLGRQRQQGEGTRGLRGGDVQPALPYGGAPSRGFPSGGEQEIPVRGGPGRWGQQKEEDVRAFSVGNVQPALAYGGSQSRGHSSGEGYSMPVGPPDPNRQEDGRSIGGYVAAAVAGATGSAAGYYASQGGGHGGWEDEEETPAQVQSRSRFAYHGVGNAEQEEQEEQEEPQEQEEYEVQEQYGEQEVYAEPQEQEEPQEQGDYEEQDQYGEHKEQEEYEEPQGQEEYGGHQDQGYEGYGEHQEHQEYKPLEQDYGELIEPEYTYIDEGENYGCGDGEDGGECEYDE